MDLESLLADLSDGGVYAADHVDVCEHELPLGDDVRVEATRGGAWREDVFGGTPQTGPGK